MSIDVHWWAACSLSQVVSSVTGARADPIWCRGCVVGAATPLQNGGCRRLTQDSPDARIGHTGTRPPVGTVLLCRVVPSARYSVRAKQRFPPLLRPTTACVEPIRLPWLKKYARIRGWRCVVLPAGPSVAVVRQPGVCMGLSVQVRRIAVVRQWHTERKVHAPRTPAGLSLDDRSVLVMYKLLLSTHDVRFDTRRKAYSKAQYRYACRRLFTSDFCTTRGNEWEKGPTSLGRANANATVAYRSRLPDLVTHIPSVSLPWASQFCSRRCSAQWRSSSALPLRSPWETA